MKAEYSTCLIWDTQPVDGYRERTGSRGRRCTSSRGSDVGRRDHRCEARPRYCNTKESANYKLRWYWGGVTPPHWCRTRTRGIVTRSSGVPDNLYCVSLLVLGTLCGLIYSCIGRGRRNVLWRSGPGSAKVRALLFEASSNQHSASSAKRNLH